MASVHQRFLAHYGSAAGQDLFLQLRALIQANQMLDYTQLKALEQSCQRPLLDLDGRDGSVDGAAWFHSSPEQREQAAALMPAILKSLDGELGQAAGVTPPILWAFPLIQHIMEQQLPLQQTARRLLFQGDDPLSIKVAYLILGALSSPAQEDELDSAMLLGRHEEFAWYASRYLYQKLANPEAQLWELAMANSGWGRIMSLKVLLLLYERNPVPTPICSWLWNSGYNNAISPGYTAVEILVQARPKDILMRGRLDEPTMLGVQTVLQAALPHIDVSRWPDAAFVFKHYRRHAGDSYRTDFLPND